MASPSGRILTRSADFRPPREIHRPARYEEAETKKRTSAAAQGTFVQTSRPAKKGRSTKRVELPKMPDSVHFTFVATRRKSGAEVEQEFLSAWEKAKQDPRKWDLRSPNCLIQPRHFIEACDTFFSKGTPNPFRITVEPATNPAMGRGAFITNGAKKGDVLGFYPLELEPYSGRNRSDYLFCYDTVPELEEYSLDAQRVKPEENFTPFINDIPGCTNAKFVPYYTEQGPIMVLVATKDFKKGVKTELSVDYGKLYWDAINKKKQTIERPPQADMEVEKKEPPSIVAKKPAPLKQKRIGDLIPQAKILAEKIRKKDPLKGDPKIRFNSPELVKYLYPPGTKFSIRPRDPSGNLRLKFRMVGSTPQVTKLVETRQVKEVTPDGTILTKKRSIKNGVYDSFLPKSSLVGRIVLGRAPGERNKYVLVNITDMSHATMPQVDNLPYTLPKPKTVECSFFDLLPLPGATTIPEAMEALRKVGLTPAVAKWVRPDGTTAYAPLYEPFTFTE